MKAEIRTLLEEAWQNRVEESYAEAVRLVDTARELCSDNDAEALGRVFHVYMQIKFDQGNLPEAITWSKQSIACYKRAGIRLKVAHAIRHLAERKLLKPGWKRERCTIRYIWWKESRKQKKKLNCCGSK